MSEFKSLKVVDRFKAIYEKFGVDYGTMRQILEMKLTLDSRRVPVVIQTNQSKEPKGNQFLKSLWIYILFGLMLLLFVFGDNYMLQMSIMFGMMAFVLMTSFISDFSDVLLDVKDKTILGRLPISKRVVNAAKWTHILIYMTILTLSFIGIATAVMLGVQGLVYTLLFIVMTLLLLMLILVLTGLLYVFVLRFLDGETLKNIINYIQIALSIGLVVGYQLIIRAFDIVDFSVNYHFALWHYLIPPIWFAVPFEVLKHGVTSGHQIAMMTLAVVLPLLALFIYLKLMPSFESNLEKLMNSSSTKAKGHLWMRLMGRVFNRTSLHRRYFEFCYRIVSESRTFKLKVYPSYGLAIILPFLMMFVTTDVSMAEMRGTYTFMAIYYQAIMIGMFVHMFQFSDEHGASWIFEANHVPEKRGLYAAALKVFWAKYFVPVFLITSIVFYFYFEKMTLVDLGIILLVSLLQTLIAYNISAKDCLPFAESYKNINNAGYTFKAFLLMFLIVPFVVVHYVLAKFGNIWLLTGFLLVLLASFIIYWKILFKDKK